jgi:hypothetical protein
MFFFVSLGVSAQWLQLWTSGSTSEKESHLQRMMQLQGPAGGGGGGERGLGPAAAGTGIGAPALGTSLRQLREWLACVEAALDWTRWALVQE